MVSSYPSGLMVLDASWQGKVRAAAMDIVKAAGVPAGSIEEAEERVVAFIDAVTGVEKTTELEHVAIIDVACGIAVPVINLVLHPQRGLIVSDAVRLTRRVSHATTTKDKVINTIRLIQAMACPAGHDWRQRLAIAGDEQRDAPVTYCSRCSAIAGGRAGTGRSLGRARQDARGGASSERSLAGDAWRISLPLDARAFLEHCIQERASPGFSTAEEYARFLVLRGVHDLWIRSLQLPGKDPANESAASTIGDSSSSGPGIHSFYNCKVEPGGHVRWMDHEIYVDEARAGETVIVQLQEDDIFIVRDEQMNVVKQFDFSREYGGESMSQ